MTAAEVGPPAGTGASITGIHHVGLLVSDLDAALRFYRDLLGLPVRTDRPEFGIPGAWLELASEQQLHLFQGPPPADSGQHLAFATDDLEAAVERLRASGIKVTTFPRGAIPTQAVAHDPSGNRIELYASPG
ncbi:MAG TPA: VOC family protein [Isosphaeraceae bacterium]|nr:VOC family protein [Isosphaeraceae bacterium]